MTTALVMGSKEVDLYYRALLQSKGGGRRGQNQELATQLGYSPAYIGQLLDGQKPFTRGVLERMREAFHLTNSQMEEEGRRLIEGIEDAPVKPEPDGCLRSGNYALVKKVSAKLAGGDGSFEVEDDFEGFYAFRESWLRKRGSIPDMVLMDVTGDSMYPTLPDGTMVLIDKSQNNIIPGRIYAVGIDEYARCKRLDVGPGKLILISDNKDVYPREEVPVGEQSNIRILGRVIWSGREH